MKIIIKHHNKKIKLNAKKLGKFSRGLGLMFRSKNTNNLLFDFDRDVTTSITSFFVFFPFLAIWLDENNKVIDKKIVKPFTLSIKPKTEFKRLIEIPINSKNKEIVNKINLKV